MEKKGGDDLDHRDHRLSTVEGGWDGGVREVIKIIKMTNLSTVEPNIRRIEIVWQRNRRRRMRP